MKKLILFLYLFVLISCGDSFTQKELIIKRVTPSNQSDYLYYYQMQGIWTNNVGIYSNDTFFVGDRVKMVKDTSYLAR